MSKLFDKFRDEVNERNDKIFKVIAVSNRLQEALGLNDEELRGLDVSNHRISCGSYDIIAVARNFRPWLVVLEIIEKGAPSDLQSLPGGDFQPSWMSDEDVRGFSSINLPPEHVVNEVIRFIKKNY